MKIIGAIIVLVLIVCEIKLIDYCMPPTQDEIWAFHAKFGCVRSGEFVGKNATPVYNCNGTKYTARELFQGALAEKRK